MECVSSGGGHCRCRYRVPVMAMMMITMMTFYDDNDDVSFCDDDDNDDDGSDNDDCINDGYSQWRTRLLSLSCGLDSKMVVMLSLNLEELPLHFRNPDEIVKLSFRCKMSTQKRLSAEMI